MTPQDVTIFEILAVLFTVSFMLLTYHILRFLRQLEEARYKLLGLVALMERRMEPIVSDLRLGAAHFRVAGESSRGSAEQLADWVDMLGRFGTFTRISAKGLWAMLAQGASAVLKQDRSTK